MLIRSCDFALISVCDIPSKPTRIGIPRPGIICAELFFGNRQINRLRDSVLKHHDLLECVDDDEPGIILKERDFLKGPVGSSDEQLLHNDQQMQRMHVWNSYEDLMGSSSTI